jgi:iron complex outermembrane receptor protein
MNLHQIRKTLFVAGCIYVPCQLAGQSKPAESKSDSTLHFMLKELTITASRVPESILRSPISIDQMTSHEAKQMGSPSCFDAIENNKGVQVITPSLGFKVVNTRGFANTTNVRFTQLIDGVDNQAPHIGAPIANALGANDLDIDKIEIVQGTASALYGMNAINGLANIKTKSPFLHQGLSIQQLSGVNHVGNNDPLGAQLYTTTNLRYAKAFNDKMAFKINGSLVKGTDWMADNRTDLAPSVNASTGLMGADNPAFDEVNGYGNESSNRKTLTLNGKKYVVARTGYREVDIANNDIRNYKADAGLYFKPSPDKELSIGYKGALINTNYQRSNRFRLEDYTLHQYVMDYSSKAFLFKAYCTQENTGKSYNLRSLAENMDRAYKFDDQWFADYTKAYNNAIGQGLSIAKAHQTARATSDNGRFLPGTDAYNQKKSELININNWDQGAALRVRSSMIHSEGLVSWDKLFPTLFSKIDAQLLSGFDHRTYIIVPDGNYFINPVDASSNLTYGKTGGFVQINKDLFNKILRLGATLRADKADYFEMKFNPRLTVVYTPSEELSVRASYQSGYRFPSIFEGFSNVNSGGVKRVGGLKIMSDGIFENSYTKASIDAFQAKVTSDINTLGLSQSKAIELNKSMLKKNPYTYLRPEYVRSFELGIKGLALRKDLYFDADFYYNSYDNFIAQVEASVPNTTIVDSIPTYLYSKTKQNRYRLWTNSTSKIYNYGASLGLKYRYNDHWTLVGNGTFSKLDKTEDKDGLEDGFNTPLFSGNATVIASNIWKKLGASITGRYQTKYDYVSFLVSGVVPSYWTLDAQINYTFERPGILAKLGATNLLNKSYYTMLGGANVGAMYYLSLTWDISK